MTVPVLIVGRPFPAQKQKVSGLYRRFRSAIHSRALHVLKDAAEAEDATQEVFMRVIRHADRIPDDDAAIAWIHRICMNYCLNVIRTRKSRSRELDPVESYFEGPERRTANLDFAERVLERAPEKIASAARLYYVDGLEQQHVADALNVTRRTVCSRLEQFLETARVVRQNDEATLQAPYLARPGRCA